jgi:dihydrofolate reductase
MGRDLIYSMQVSLDGFIADPDGKFDWSRPGEELHRFHNEQTRELDAHLLGRRLYETMVYWETASQEPPTPEHAIEFARLWKRLPKIVFSRTLDSVEGDARLFRGNVAEEVAELKAQSGKDIAVGGAGLAATCIELGLVDEYRTFVYPIVLGGGTPHLPPLDERIGLQLVETRSFPCGVVYLRHRRTAGAE